MVLFGLGLYIGLAIGYLAVKIAVRSTREVYPLRTNLTVTSDGLHRMYEDRQ